MQKSKEKSFINQSKELEINGFSLKYIHCGFMHVVTQLQK